MYSYEEPYKMKALLTFDLQFASFGLDICSKLDRLYKVDLLHVTALSTETLCALLRVASRLSHDSSSFSFCNRRTP